MVTRGDNQVNKTSIKALSSSANSLTMIGIHSMRSSVLAPALIIGVCRQPRPLICRLRLGGTVAKFVCACE